MGVGWGMVKTWLGAIQGYRAKQTMAHLSKKRWNYMGKRLHQGGRGLKTQKGAGLAIPFAMLASWGINKIRKKIQGGSGIRRTRKFGKRRRKTRTLILQ